MAFFLNSLFMKGEGQKSINPYPGIRSFNIDEHHLFFGRDRQISEISKILLDNRFVAISGYSGSGKSSIIKAGIIPRFIERKHASAYLILRPGNNPIKNFTEEVINFFVEEGESRRNVEKKIAKLQNSEHAIEEIFSATDRKILIYIDQFEELFRYRESDDHNEKEAVLFVKNIINATQTKTSKLFVIISLRSDFLSDCTNFEGLTEIINKGHYLLPKMTLEEKEEAVRKPAETMGAVFSEAFISEIREHIANEDIDLPVLQHTLMRTWDYWLFNSMQGEPIDIEHYNAIGTVHGAISMHAESIYNSFSEEKKKLAGKIFRSLTHGLEKGRGVRNPQKLSRLVEITGAKERDVVEVLDKFRSEGISFIRPSQDVILTPDTVIDISHESIMNLWGRLAEWLNYEAETAERYIRLARSAELYQEGKTGLLVNPDLQIALNWMEDEKPNLAWALRYDPAFERTVDYILYSKEQYDKNMALLREKREKRIKRSRLIALFMGIISFILLIFMLIALNMKFKAEQSEKEALIKREEALKETKLAEKRRREAIALELIAKQQQDIAEQNRLLAERQKQYAVQQQKEALYQKKLALIARNEAIVARDLARKLQIEAERLRDEAIEQKLIAEQEKQRSTLSEAKTDSLRRLAIAKTLAVKSLQIFENNKKSANLSAEEHALPNIMALQAYYFNKKYGGNPYDPDIFDALIKIGNASTKLANIHSDAVRSLTVSPDGTHFITASDDGKIADIQIQDTKNIDYLNTGSLKTKIRKIIFSPDGKYIVAGTKYGYIMLWTSDATSRKPYFVKEHKGIIAGLAFIDGYKFVSAGKSGEIILWKITVASFNELKKLQTNEAFVDVSYDSQNKKIIAANQNGKIVKYSDDLDSLAEYISPYGKISTLSNIVNGKLYVGHTNGLVEVIDIQSMKETKKWFAHNSAVTKILYNPEKENIITSGYDKSIKIFDATDLNTLPIVVRGHNAWVYTFDITKYGNTIISADAAGTIFITNVNIDELKNLVKGSLTKNMSRKNWAKYVGGDIEYSPDLPADL